MIEEEKALPNSKAMACEAERIINFRIRDHIVGAFPVKWRTQS